jgi:hypothetical protein
MHLLDLPGEIRNSIYEYVLTEEKGVSYYAAGKDIGKGWLCLQDKPTAEICEAEKEQGLPYEDNHTNELHTPNSERLLPFEDNQQDITQGNKPFRLPAGHHIMANQIQFVCRQLAVETRGLSLRYNTIRVPNHQARDSSDICVEFIRTLSPKQISRLRVVIVDMHRRWRNRSILLLMQFCYANPAIRLHLQLPHQPFELILPFFLLYGHALGKKLPYTNFMSTYRPIQMFRHMLIDGYTRKGLKQYPSCPSNLLVFLREGLLDPVEYRQVAEKDVRIDWKLSGAPGGLNSYVAFVKDIIDHGF